MPLSIVTCTCGCQHRLFLCPACGLNRSKLDQPTGTSTVIVAGPREAVTDLVAYLTAKGHAAAAACRICGWRRTSRVCPHCDTNDCPGCQTCTETTNRLALAGAAMRTTPPPR